MGVVDFLARVVIIVTGSRVFFGAEAGGGQVGSGAGGGRVGSGAGGGIIGSGAGGGTADAARVRGRDDGKRFFFLRRG